jgi:hypothetical protein
MAGRRTGIYKPDSLGRVACSGEEQPISPVQLTLEGCMTKVLSQAQRKKAVADEGAKQEVTFPLARAAGSAAVIASSCSGGREVEESQDGEQVGLQDPPDPLDRVQLRGIGSKQDKVDRWDRVKELRDRPTPVSPQPVPNQDQKGMDFLAQLAEPAPRSRESRSAGARGRCFGDGGGNTGGPDRGEGRCTGRR